MDNERKIGSYVSLLKVEPHWFEYEIEESCKILQEACKGPLKVVDIYDGKVELELPAVKDHDGDFTMNSITTPLEKVTLIR